MGKMTTIGHVSGCIVAAVIGLLPGAGRAQSSPTTGPQAGSVVTIEALPGRLEGPPREGQRSKIVVPTPTPPSILAPEIHPIDLIGALRLANVQNPELNIARTRILEAVAMRQLAAAYFLPSINPGMDYDSHTGVLQQSNGNILGLQRSSVYVGAGANAVGSGTVNIPGVYYAGNIGVGIYNYLASKQVVRGREFETVGVRNQMLLQVAVAYSELLRSEGRRAARIQARDEAREIARLTAEYARSGQGRPADANRAATELARWEASIQAAEAEILTSSARLCQLVNLDPSIRLHPTDAVVVPQPIVPDPIPLKELIALGLVRRPELTAQRAAIEAALLRLGAAKVMPFSPNFILGFSAGGFGGGSNLVRPIFGGFSGREDLDVIAFWTLQNLGAGNVALIRGANARLQVNQFQQVELLNMVRDEIAEAYARTHARYAQIGTYEDAVRSGYLSFHEDLDSTRAGVGRGGARTRDVLPIELLNSFELLAGARLDYLDAIVDYNEAQFAMYVALGQPPADALAHPVPTEGIAPTHLPKEATPPGTISPLPIPATPEASQRPARVGSIPAPVRPRRDAVRTAGFRPDTAPTSRSADRSNPSGQ